MAEKQARMSETATTVDGISRDISSSMSRSSNLGGSSIIITPQLARQLQDPQAQAALVERLAREHPGFRFSVERILPADQSGQIGEPILQIGVERFIRRSADEISSEISGSLRRFPNLGGSSLTITPELFRQLQQDPQAQQALLDRLGSEHPGYRFTITSFTPTFQHGDIGAPGVSIGVERFVQRSTDEISSEVRGSLRRHPELDASAIIVSPDVYLRLQDPAAQAELTDRLARENPGYRFTITHMIPAERNGDLGLPSVQFDIEPLRKDSR
jgi:hypothetical protein